MLTPKVLTTLLLILTCNAVAFSQTKTPSAEVIVEKMLARYTAFSSYEDSGVIETVTDGPLPTRSTDIVFKTYFTRPQKLRFEWFLHSVLASPGKSVVWSDGVKFFSAYNFDDGKIETNESLRMTIAGATGVSRGSVNTAYDLLNHKDDRPLFGLLDRLSLKQEETFEGDECYVIEGHHASGDAWLVWITKNDFLLRKVKRPSIDDTFTEDIRRNIRVDQKLPETTYQPKVVAGRLADDIDKEKEADIRRLLDLVQPRERINQQMRELVPAMKRIAPHVPEKTIVDVIAELNFDSEMVQRIYVPLYDWHYTGDEIKQLLKFYETPIGERMLRSSTIIEVQAMSRGVSIGQELMKRIEERLKSKGYKVTAE